MKYENEGLRVYFLSSANAAAIQNELQKTNPDV